MEFEKKYPDVIYQKYWFPHKISEVYLDDLDIKPIEKPTKPSAPKPPSSFLNIFLFSGSWLSLCFGILILFGQFYTESFFLLCFGGICFLIQKEIYSSFENEESKFQKTQKKYLEELEKYNNYISGKSQLKSINSSSSNINKFLETKRNNLISDISEPIEVNSKAGITEEFFENKLNSFFSNHIKSNKLRILKNYGIQMFTGHNDPIYYSCDFIITHVETGIIFNIEIDEPYSFEEKIPLHYWEFNKKTKNYKHSQSERDYQLSTFHNWIVVRFSERQIALHSKECCMYLSSLIKIVALDKNISHFKMDDTFIDDAWTIFDSIEMIKNNFRQTYLHNIIN